MLFLARMSPGLEGRPVCSVGELIPNVHSEGQSLTQCLGEWVAQGFSPFCRVRN